MRVPPHGKDCSMDNPDAIVPADHIWVRSKLKWMKLTDGLPAYDEKRDNE
jgi:hypothetical protein